MPRINYVIGAWSGYRIKEDITHRPSLSLAPHRDTAIDYLKKQVACLERYRHGLTQITLAVAYNPQINRPYLAESERLNGSLIQQAKFHTLWRERNDGGSYASWCNTVAIYKNHFDYYIFVEDDYVPVTDDFDSIMVQEYEKSMADYLCTYKHNGVYVTNGIIGPRALRKFKWNLPYQHPECEQMRVFLTSMTTAMPSPPWTCAPYYGDHGFIEEGQYRYTGIFFFGKGKFLFAPTQMVAGDGTVEPIPNPVHTD